MVGYAALPRTAKRLPVHRAEGAVIVHRARVQCVVTPSVSPARRAYPWRIVEDSARNDCGISPHPSWRGTFRAGCHLPRALEGVVNLPEDKIGSAILIDISVATGITASWRSPSCRHRRRGEFRCTGLPLDYIWPRSWCSCWSCMQSPFLGSFGRRKQHSVYH